MPILTILEIGVIAATAVTNLLLGAAGLSRNPKNRINQVFFLLAAAYGLWGFSLLFYEYPIILSSKFWIYSTYFFVNLFEALTLLFSFVFPKPMFKKTEKLAYVVLTLYLIFCNWLLFATDYWIIDVVMTPDRGLQTILGPGYGWWVIVTWVILGWAIANYLINSRRLTGRYKAQAQYLFIGFALWGIIVNIPDVIIPIFYKDTRYFAISTVVSLAFTISVFYGIVKHRFMDIRMVIARSLSYSLLLFALLVIYSTLLFGITALLPGIKLGTDNLIISSALAMFVAFTFQPLRAWLEKITDRIFFKERYDTEDLLHSLSTTMATTLTLSTLSYKALEILIREMRLTKASFALIQKKKVYVLELDHEKHIQITLPEIEKLNQSGKMQIFDELEDGPVKEIMGKYNISLALPLSTQKHFIGFLFLGEKASGDIYYDQDINFLTILGPELSVALQNAQRFEEISQFNITLQEEVRKATAELQEANKKLTEIDKQKDEFISIASHDLRSPLSVIKNYLWLIESNKAKVPGSVMESVSEATKSTERAITLVNDMLDVSRIEMGRFEVKPVKMNITKLAGEIASGLTPSAKEKGIKLEVAADDDYFVKADKDRIAQVFGNLLGNALKFTPQKGEITVNFEKMPGKLSTSVTNTGPGIKKEDLPKLFTKFGRLDNSLSSVSVNPGTGLGLYISKRIIDMHGGEIGVKSEVGKGATFTFSLPIAK